MNSSVPFKIAYIGGGSRFVVVLLHGLAAQAKQLRALGRPIELALMDINTQRAGPMARYAEITASQTGLNLTTDVTDDRDRALEDADWILFSVGPWQEIRELRERLRKPLGNPHGESTPMAAIEAASLWSYMRLLAEDIHRLSAPQAAFSTLVNPTDVLSGAFERAFGIRSIGTCVEVPQLKTWLCHQLKVEYDDIHLEHIGANHVGWVSRWTVAGQDGSSLLSERLPDIMSPPDWEPSYEWFTSVFQATGYMRSSPYHHWPMLVDWDEDRERRRKLYRGAIKPLGTEFRRGKLEKALAEGKMIEESMPPRVHYEHRMYNYMNTRHTLGALAVGLAGGSADAVPMQIQNGKSNPELPTNAWLEIPTSIENGIFRPQYVPPLPDWVFGQTNMLIHQRKLLMDWLVGEDADGLTKALMAWSDVVPVKPLLDLAEELPKILS